MKKAIYYALGAVLAIVPTVFAFASMVALSYSDLSNGAWAAACVAIFGFNTIYLLLMFGE